MAEQPTGSAPSPDDKSGQAPNNNPPSPGSSQPAGGQNPNGGGKVEIDEKEYLQLKRDAGRFRSRKEGGKESRDARRSRERSAPNSDDTDEEIRRRDHEISQRDAEITRLKVQNGVRDLLESDDFKNLPNAIKQAVRRNPMGFVREDSKEVRHYMEDIEDYLHDTLDEMGGQSTSSKKEEEDPEQKHQTPPARGSGPESPNPAADEDLTGKTGTARSTAVLRNMLKNKGKK